MEDGPKYRVEIPNDRYYKELIACQSGCPVHTDSRAYVQAIARGEFETAYLIARAPNPLASICGRICGAPCEAACRRGKIDAPVAIRPLKRVVTELYGPESGVHTRTELLDWIANSPQATENIDREDIRQLRDELRNRVRYPLKPFPSVAIIGSGPAGLAAAHDLAVFGVKSIVYEREKVAGGMLAVGIPDYRLPPHLIQTEIDVIRSLGVEFVTGVEVGKDTTIDNLLGTHAAVIVAVGAKVPRPLRVPGGDAKGVIGGVDFLRSVALGEQTDIGRRVVVIGGGNVAYDAARTAVRRVYVERDATRLARKVAEPNAEVHLACLEKLEEMLADQVEILEGEEEGVIRHNGYGPAEVLTGPDGRVTGIKLVRVISLWDENRRFSPKYDVNDSRVIECDTILVCIGQSVDWGLLEGIEGLAKDQRGNIPCDAETGRTANRKIYLAGDAAYGPKLAIHAVAAGKKVARQVALDLGHAVPLKTRTESSHTPCEHYYREAGFERLTRQTPPAHSVAERLRSTQSPVERTFSLEDARDQGHRCLSCDVNTVFDSSLCILCGGCVDVCPEDCLKIVSIAKLDRTPEIQRLVDELGDQAAETSAILKDEDRCIRCALCAERCPTGSITMEKFTFREVYEHG